MSSVSTVWEDTDGCANQYMCALDIYLMTVLSYSYGVIMDLANNAPGHGEKLLMESIQRTNVISVVKWNLLVN